MTKKIRLFPHPSSRVSEFFGFVALPKNIPVHGLAIIYCPRCESVYECLWLSPKHNGVSTPTSTRWYNYKGKVYFNK